MATEFSKSNILDIDTNTINTKNCSYCNIPFTEKLWCKECINSLEKLAENGDKEAMFNFANCYRDGEGTEKNLEKAFHWYQKAAENGNEKAMFNLAKCYVKGEGTEKNLEKAFHWYQKAAEKDYTKAMYNLAIFYENGKGTEMNLEKVFHWYQKAAENGIEEAMNNLANCYKNGKGTEKNLEKAFYLYQKAAVSGIEEAMFNLANCYSNGEGTEKNLEKAFHWYQKVAENGDDETMFILANYYSNGEGTEKNLEKAFHWYQKAAENGNKMAMNNLANCYKDEKGTEKNLEKACHLYQKAAENGVNEAMFNLAECYKNGEGTEKNLEKAFHWYQKVAENGDEGVAIFKLARCYKNGEGTEKNLEKAFHWYLKAAESGNEEAMLNLANCYNNGEGIEKNLEKTFYWCKKVVENGDEEGAIFKLARCYENGEGTEKNLEKAFHCYQKAAENGVIEAMNKLVKCYKDGEGTEKNLEKAFYWYQKALAESNKVKSKDEVELVCNKCKKPYIDYPWYHQCNECKQPFIEYQWCQQCNVKQFQQDFSKWTSKNEFIDKFIQEAQLNAKNSYGILEWIPYNKLLNISYCDKGGFSEIHKAIWSDGPIFSWNYNKKQWDRQTDYEVILKTLKNSSNLNSKFLDEWKYHYNCQKNSFSKFIQFFGITQDPNNLNYIIVMSYAKKGNLRKCLSDIIKFKWQDKLQLLKKIILGLKVIHESNLTHGDFHDGNILLSDNHNELFIIDLGLCKPINGLDSDNNKVNEIYGVMPYMAPELFRNKLYTPESDIYSFSMIMWEFTSGIPPFYDRAHDHHLILSVCNDERPEIIENTPKCYMDLIKKCWDSNPSNRPTIIMLENIISEWIRCINEFYVANRDGNYVYKVSNIDGQLEDDMFEFVKANKALVQSQEQVNTSIIQSHPQACFISRNVTKEIEKSKNVSESIVQEYSADLQECMVKFKNQ
ncbi:kinase-like domain-containing protein [Rhizophagus irregularis DAOM 181602=DAOM 197198]|uniref:Kinase-like domain-containing protein n=1 Tax=Rhizophagus irregularis (strain DAOM 181602 / DAOM 197198 / MUCL 43194) TaxID=747089 RepID=A0A2H5SK65_RHIID|nr:kinase-like domain-containing protein [Rhizophagus irregularis DAOM 181602=DAOM 197198]POG66287.1 kinase-like domain-containing protein [Rhizophagus irregularis DAOM 181602=DAOM 197198]|eukprot:XP_025173153.1 kinase-like domain-containing protein [Rhizophagus irregularis DAOM 181602=DAOM 197198]